MRFRKSNPSKAEFFNGKHRFEHWYRDNTIYFITSSTRDHFHAFAREDAKLIFWERFSYYTKLHGFVPWITTLLSNHYHTLGYLERGEELGEMMRKLHGSVAKLANDTFPLRHTPFWREKGHHDYFDGCIRDELQCRRAYKYILTQCRRHHICSDPRDYPHTHVSIDVDRGIARASELNALLAKVPYARYEGR